MINLNNRYDDFDDPDPMPQNGAIRMSMAAEFLIRREIKHSNAMALIMRRKSNTQKFERGFTRKNSNKDPPKCPQLASLI